MREDDANLVSYPRINPAFTPDVVHEDKVVFTTGPWSGPVFEISDEERDGNLARLVSMLDGTTHLSDILDSFDSADHDEIRMVLRYLQEKSIVRDPGGQVDERRAMLGGYCSLFDRSSIAPERLAKSHVFIVGAGELGRIVAQNLLAAGVAKLKYLPLSRDGDRWMQSNSSDGLTLAEPREMRDCVSAADFVALATDRPYPDIATRLNDATQETGTPWVVGQLNGLDGQVGPTVYPGETACYECFRRRATAATSSRVGYRRFEEAATDTGPLLPSFAHIVGGLTSLDIVGQLAGRTGITVGGVVDFDFYDFAVQADEVLKMPRCDKCETGRERLDSPRHVTLDELVTRSNRRRK